MGHLRVRDLGKAYKRYPYKWGRAVEWIGIGPQHELNWVLRNVSFDVAAGEAVGIIGANGAGKSTLLKLLAGTIRPTSGAFETGGRLAALLELGIGFHLEYSGRDNVRMAAHILGIPGNRIEAIIEEVEQFAEIGDYIDQPVRTYSSGMQVRLAFSVATAVRPEILIVDEALSVGDAYFQHKSFDRIRRFRDLGTTLLFVSHSPGAVKSLCDRAMLLDRGQILRDDAPDAVLDYYNAMIAAQRADYEIRQHDVATGHKVTRSGNRDVTIEEIELFVDGCATRSITSGHPLTVRIALEVRNPVADLTAGILIRDRFGNDIFGSNTFHLGMNRQGVAAGERLVVEFSIAALDLGAGSYSLTAALHSFDAHTASNFDWWDRAVVFQVIRRPGPLTIGVSALVIAARWCPPNEAVDSRVPETTTLVREKLGNEN